MSFFPNPQTFLAIGPLHIQWYAVLILTGAFLTLYFSKRDLKEARYIDVDGFMDDLFIYTLWAGIIGARLWFCLFYNPSFYLSHPLEIIKIWEGGLAIHGGLFAGAAFACWFCKKKNVSFLKTADCILPNVLIAQALGRWGNFVNQECHGPEVAESFFDGILFFLKKGMYIDGHYYEPLFFFESMGCLLGWILIRTLVKRYGRRKRGDMVWSYLMWYGIVRAFIEVRRTDSLLIGHFKTAVLVSLAFVVLGLLGYFGVIDKIFVRKRKPTVLFDLDGTLIDTNRSIVEAYRDLFKKYAKEEDFTKERQVEVLGPGLRELFPTYFPDKDVDALVSEWREKNREYGDLYNKLNPHAAEVLEELKKEGCYVGIVSTKGREAIRHNLELFHIEDYVDDYCGFEDASKPKPSPEGIFNILKKNHWNKDDVIVIGDSYNDILSANNYGAYAVAYDINPDKSEVLLTAPHNRVIHDLSEVLDIVKEDHPFTYDLR
ncbi:MAG: prolipoprotein diacylglyceryl transferase [Erysipelotrichaceae bacterium]|nr:prolipoprotein diacylglyceryl transferase [Erysipelotrichaceae bacterium]